MSHAFGLLVDFLLAAWPWILLAWLVAVTLYATWTHEYRFYCGAKYSDDIWRHWYNERFVIRGLGGYWQLEEEPNVFLVTSMNIRDHEVTNG